MEHAPSAHRALLHGERGLAAAERMRATIVAVVLLGLDDGPLGRSPAGLTVCSRLVLILRTASTVYNTERVRRNRLGEARALGGDLAGTLDCCPRDRRLWALAGKEPVPGPFDFPPVPQDRQQLRREHHVAVLFSLALRDAQHHPLAVDGGHGETDGLGDAQAGGVARGQRCLAAFTPSRNWTTSSGLSTAGKDRGFFAQGSRRRWPTASGA